VIGHSIVSDISSAYEDKVIKFDVKHSDQMNSGKTQGLLVLENVYYKVDDAGNKTQLIE